MDDLSQKQEWNVTDHSIVWNALVKLSEVTGDEVMKIDPDGFTRLLTPYQSDFAEDELPDLLGGMIATGFRFQLGENHFIGSLLTRVSKENDGRFTVVLDRAISAMLYKDERAYIQVFDTLAGRIENSPVNILASRKSA